MKTLVMFDYEGAWGMPHDAPYDLEMATKRILDILSSHRVSAMFFIVGRLVEEHTELVELINARGHAIGLHGYRHERLDSLSPHALHVLQKELADACAILARITGAAPSAFRAPYLLAPHFSNVAVSTMLVELGFRWTSNRELRFPEEIFSPGRLALRSALAGFERGGGLDLTRPLGRATFAALNARSLAHDPDLDGWLNAARWLMRERDPLVRTGGLLDVAVASPLDCDVLGVPLPTEESSSKAIKFATEQLSMGVRRGGFTYNVNFHDWIIGTANRPEVLDQTLARLLEESDLADARSWSPEHADLESDRG